MSYNAEWLRTRFWPKVEIQESNQCWIWKAAVRSKGYGQIKALRSRLVLDAHRVAYELAHGSIPEGMCVLHHCDNPPCVNAEHLFLGTRADNDRDRDEKGRTKFGEQLAFSRLTTAQVEQIRMRYAQAELQDHLAAEFGVTQQHVSNIVHYKRRCWG